MSDSDTEDERGNRDAAESGRDAALDAVRELDRATRDLVADLPFEAEPSHHARLLEELVRDGGGNE